MDKAKKNKKTVNDFNELKINVVKFSSNLEKRFKKKIIKLINPIKKKIIIYLSKLLFIVILILDIK